MELNPSPVPVKSKYMNPKSTKKPSDAPNLNPKSKLREKRVFGTARNPNVPTKTANPAKAALKRAEKPSQPIRTKSPEKNQTRPKKKSVCFQENEVVTSDETEPKTPAKLPDAAAKPRRVSTPYHTADKCSKCRFDKLETSAYWLGQIKLAESVGKHSVSAAFFGLALDCKAEPIRNVRIELKKYVARHEHLNDEQQWKRLWISYGFAKEEFGENEGNEDMKFVKNDSIYDTKVVFGS